MQSDATVLEVRHRAARWARGNWRQHAEKVLQAELDITESQAERILMGQASRPLIDAMLAKWKWTFAAYVLEPLCGRFTPAGLDETLAAAEEGALAAYQRIRQLRGAPPTLVGDTADPRRDGAVGAVARAAVAPETEQPPTVAPRRAGGAR